MLLLILSFHFPFFIGLVISVWIVIFSAYDHFYNETFEYYIVKHIKILIFFYPNNFMKISVTSKYLKTKMPDNINNMK